MSEIQTKADGSEYYCSIHPQSQPESLYLWALDWHGKSKELRRNWGKIDSNPFDRVTNLALRSKQESIDHLIDHLDWISLDSKSGEDVFQFEVAQYHGNPLKILVEKIESGEQSLQMQIECNQNLEELVNRQKWKCKISFSDSFLTIDTRD